MPISYNKLINKVSLAFPDAEIELKDLVGDNNHYQLNIKCESFNNKSRLEQHRMVNNALGEELKGELHALSIITKSK